MANTDFPMGAVPRRYMNGTPWNGAGNWYAVLAADPTAMFRGDFVTLTGTADATGLYPSIAQSAAAGLVVGVAMAFSTEPHVAFDPENLERAYRPASTLMYVLVVDDKNVIFEVQEDSVGGALAITHTGLNCDITVGTGNTSTGCSAMEIDSSDSKTATAQLRLLRLADINNNAIGANAVWEVMINEHSNKGVVGI